MKSCKDPLLSQKNRRYFMMAQCSIAQFNQAAEMLMDTLRDATQ